MYLPTVLLIDADTDSVVIYSLILQHHGIQVIHAHDLEAGVRLAAEMRPDLVISDLFLPKLGGMSVVEVLRTEDATSGTPLIVLDSLSALATGHEPVLEGTNRLTKPCEPSRLLKEVQRLLGPQLHLVF
jgi:DNA-binding response OmpR family regulator